MRQRGAQPEVAFAVAQLDSDRLLRALAEAVTERSIGPVDREPAVAQRVAGLRRRVLDRDSQRGVMGRSPSGRLDSDSPAPELPVEVEIEGVGVLVERV